MSRISQADANRLIRQLEKKNPKAASALQNAAKTERKNDRKEQIKALKKLVRQNLSHISFTEELIFHPTRKWRLDYAIEEHMIAIEVHGGVFTDGRHTKGVGFTEDRVKMNEAQLLGWIVIEATTAQVKSGHLRKWVDRALEHRKNEKENRAAIACIHS